MSIDLSLHLENTHVVLTGASGFIGLPTLQALLSAGCTVTTLDLRPCPLPSSPNLLSLTCDISSESAIRDAFAAAVEHFGPVECCIALAGLDLSVLPHGNGLSDVSLEQWKRTLDVNVTGTMLTAREWLRGLRTYAQGDPSAKTLRNVSLIIVGSESGTFGERINPDYAAGKAAVQVGLMKSMMGDVGRVWQGARVNVVAPGPVDTEQFRKECAENEGQFWVDAQGTTAMKVPVPPEAVAKSILFLASEAWSGNVMGQVLAVDSGKQGKILWLKEEC